MVLSLSSLSNARLSTIITAAGAGVVVVLLLLSNIDVNNNNTLLQSKSVFAQQEEEEGGVVAQAEENATATTTTSEAATNETTTTTTTAAASPARNNNMTGVQFLFIQGALSGTLSQINATTYTLELENLTDKTILFSDRPDRIVTSQSTSDFVGNWTMGGEDSFAADPPNAVLVLDDEVEQREESAVVELFNPEYDPVADTFRYDITADNATTTTTATSSSINLPSEFGQSTLVIDSGGAPSFSCNDDVCTEGDPECTPEDTEAEPPIPGCG